MDLDRKKIASLLKEEKVQSYSYSIGFFLIFSLFVYFAIRPNLITAFNLEKEKQDLKLQNKQYEEQILQIVNYQSTIEQYRDKMGLLDEAVPPSPNVVKVIDDIKQSASESGIALTSVSIDTIEFKKDVEQYEEVYNFKINTTGKIQVQQFDAFLASLINQRRIKSIDTFQINKVQTEDNSESYNISLSITGFYL
jgi:Tfp pilus assembly protein PilO